MKKNLASIFTIVLIILPLLIRAQPANFINRTDSLLNYLYQNDRFCGSILLSKGEKIIYQKTFVADESENPNDIYRIGSITKMFTAVIIYQLAEEKKLSLNDKLDKYFPQVKYAGEITIQQMLGHQTGIRDLINNADYAAIKPLTMTRAETIERIGIYKPAFKPGKKTEYSNSNYVLLGFIIEDITGMPFSNALSERITGKLGLYNTWLEEAGDPVERNKGYLFNGAGWVVENNETNASISFSAGAIISNTHDLNIFLNSLFNYELIQKASVDSMCALTNATYGHGIFYTPFEKHKGYGHTGHIDEFRSAATYFPADSITFILCLNGLNYAMNDIALGVLSYYFERDYKFPDVTRIQMSEETLQKYEGLYRLKLFHFIPVAKVKIKSENGVLATATEKNFEEEKVFAEPVAPDTFKSFQYKSTLQFIYKKNGRIKGCSLEQGKNKLYCKRLS